MSACENGPIRPPFAFDGERRDLRRQLREVLGLQGAGANVLDLLLGLVVFRDVDAAAGVRRHLDEDLAQRHGRRVGELLRDASRSTAAPLLR